MITLAKKRIKNVFDDTLEKVSSGKQPNISAAMRKQGYSETSVRSQKVTQTKTWAQLLSRIEDREILDMFTEIVQDKKDKRARIAAGIELLKLKDRYPAQKSKIVGLFETLSNLEENSADG